MAAGKEPQKHPKPIEEPNLLVVEGKDEERFFARFLKHLGVANVDIRGVGGKHSLRRELRLLTQPSPGFENVEALGVIRDADDDPANAFKSVCDALGEVCLAVPKECGEICGEEPRVGVMILPGKDRRGALEGLCFESVQDDAAIKCVEDYFDCLVEQAQKMPGENAKKKLQVFIASREGAARLLGEAAEAGVWPWESPAFDEVKGFLRTLFG
ncbi:MAG: DUF3226 domain-containing protein [Planctomycetota bacterium]|jgi:hypothetical protein